jgi:glycine/D-amino acid oxidase-like deaminating enzyme
MELTPPWAEELSAEERAALDPGPGRELPGRPDVLVVGGGILGVATAAACAEIGLGSVLVVERSRLGSGATGGAAGLLVPEAHAGTDPEPLVELGRAGLGAWRDLQASAPRGVGLVDIDWRARPGPSIAARQARLNPLLAVARLVAWRRPEVAVATRVEALSVETRGGRVHAVATTAGAVQAGAVIFCTGEPPRLAGLDLDLPSGRIKGHLILTGPSSARLTGGDPAASAPGGAHTQDSGPGGPAGAGLPGSVGAVATDLGQGRLLAGGTLDAGDQAPEVRAEVVTAIRADLEAAVPAAREVPLTHAWYCFRPLHPDRLPVVDRVPGLENAWVASGHFRTGILAAPAAGARLAEWVTTGRPQPELAAFTATRFGGP